MKLYKPVLIESAEQAEALPIGTVAHDRDHDTEPDLIPYIKITPKLWVSVWDVDEAHEIGAYGVCPNSHIVGDTALVPIEAEEETTALFRGFAGVFHVSRSTGSFPTPQRRLVTPWEEA